MTLESPRTTDRPAGVPSQRTARPTAPRYDVELVSETTDDATGLRWRRVVTGDESQHSPTRSARQAAITAQDALLRAHPAWKAPDVVGGHLVTPNAVSQWIYDAPGMHEWRRDLVPTARALYPMQRPWSTHLPSGGPIDDVTRSFFTDSLDAIGIRSRAVLMRDAVRRGTRELLASGASGRLSWVSLACGAAVPVLDALVAVEADVHLSLVDLDPSALSFAAELATDAGLVHGTDYTLLERNLIAGIVARDSLVTELGEGTAAVVDALGIFEYLTDVACVRLLRNAHRLLRPGGMLVVANMLSDRREIDFNQRGVGWPKIFPRSTEEVLALVERAGLPLHRTTVSIPQDGVYAVVDVTR